MTGKTHATVAICVAVPLITLSNIALLPLAFIGTKLPDIDRIIGIKHRGFTHSILCMGITTLAVLLVSTPGALFYFIGYVSHLLLDSLTITKVPLLYPCKRKIGLGIFRTNGIEDQLIRGLAVLSLICIMVSRLKL